MGAVLNDHEPAQRVTLCELAEAMREPVRIELLLSVFERGGCVFELAERHALDTPTVSRHLSHLARAGILAWTQRTHRHVYGPGPSATVIRANGGAIITFLSSDGGSVVWHLSPEAVDRYTRGR